VVIATGHCFNHANKRTAYRAMEICAGAKAGPQTGIPNKSAT